MEQFEHAKLAKISSSLSLFGLGFYLILYRLFFIMDLSFPDDHISTFWGIHALSFLFIEEDYAPSHKKVILIIRISQYLVD
jgi:hypothetical protein